jgi:hypothetical protein
MKSRERGRFAACLSIDRNAARNRAIHRHFLKEVATFLQRDRRKVPGSPRRPAQVPAAVYSASA